VQTKTSSIGKTSKLHTARHHSVKDKLIKINSRLNQGVLQFADLKYLVDQVDILRQDRDNYLDLCYQYILQIKELHAELDELELE